MKVLITAGPTKEYIDDVRFISNPSSGGMGLALAGESVKRGYETALVLGPVPHSPMYSVKVVPVVSSEEMTSKTLAELRNGYDALLCSAALADFTPKEKADGKIRSGGDLVLELKPTRKLIAEARKQHPKLKIFAFKAEYGGSREELVAAGKRLLDVADLVFVNDVSRDVFGSEETEALIVGKFVRRIDRVSKAKAAEEVFDMLEELMEFE